MTAVPGRGRAPPGPLLHERCGRRRGGPRLVPAFRQQRQGVPDEPQEVPEGRLNPPISSPAVFRSTFPTESPRPAIRAGLWRGRVDEVIPVAFSPGYELRKRALTAVELAKLTADRAARAAFIVATYSPRRRRRGARDGLPPRHEAEDAVPHGPDREPRAAVAPRVHTRAHEGTRGRAVPRKH